MAAPKNKWLDFKARPEGFSCATVDAIGQANTLLVNKITELKSL